MSKAIDITSEGSVRVDLLGGTIDLAPINYILPNVITLNVATSLKAKVKLTASDEGGILFKSKDYQGQEFYEACDFNQSKLQQGHFGPYEFVARLMAHFGATKNLVVELSSGSPPGAGLGGSSAMGVTLYQALAKYFERPVQSLQDKQMAINETQAIESIILNKGPAGYQDYYPALFGGILALKADIKGVEIEQLYQKELAKFLEDHLTLVYSGQTRSSGINNWEVYKSFFDGQKETRLGLEEIAKLSYKAYQSIKNKKWDDLCELISLEGQSREKLFPNILTPEIKKLTQELQKDYKGLGVKACGAGGGGCFILVHPKQFGDEIKQRINQASMKVLDFSIDKAHE